MSLVVIREFHSLHAAAWSRDLELVQVLLEFEADVNSRSRSDWTPLHETSKGFYFLPHDVLRLLSDVARLLLERGADVNARSNDGSTLLHIAVKNRRVMVVCVLLEYGAHAGAKDKRGGTPFQIASAKRYDEILELLSEHAASIFALASAYDLPVCNILPW